MDCLSEDSFSRAQRQMEKLEQETKDAQVILLVNKIDQLLGYHKNSKNLEKVLSNCPFYDQLLLWQESQGVPLFWCSAKENDNIEEIFEYIK